MTTKTLFFAYSSASALLGSAVASPGAAASIPDAAELARMTARFAPVDIGADITDAPGQRAPGAGQARRGRSRARRHLPAPGVGRQFTAADGPRRRRHAARAGPPALLHDQQGPVVESRSQRALHSRRAGQAAPGAGSTPPAPRKPTSTPGSRRSTRANAAPPPASSPPSAATSGARSRPCPTASNTSRNWDSPRRSCARPPPLTTQPTLKRFLESRADAFLSNDYYASDVAWMELDATLEPTIGPYEVYEDEWFNYKAAFEAFITVRDEAETKQLARFAAELQRLEDAPADRRAAIAIPSSAPSPPSASSTSSSPPATAITVSRPRRSICPTTSGSSAKRAASG